MSTVEEKRIAELEAENRRLRTALGVAETETPATQGWTKDVSPTTARTESHLIDLLNAHADLLMWRVDANGRFVQATGKGFETINCPAEAVLGKRIVRFLPEGDVREDMLRKLQHGQPAAGAFSMDGFRLDCRAVPTRQKRADGRIPDVTGSMWVARILVTPSKPPEPVSNAAAVDTVPRPTDQPCPVDDLLRLMRQLPMGIVTADQEGGNLQVFQTGPTNGGRLWQSVFDVFDSPVRDDLQKAIVEATESGQPQTVWTMRAWEQPSSGASGNEDSQPRILPPRHYVCCVAPADGQPEVTGHTPQVPAVIAQGVSAGPGDQTTPRIQVSAKHAEGIIAVWLELTTELRHYTRDLQRRAEIERDMLDASLLQVVSILSHRINNPLGAVVNYANGCIRRLQSVVDNGENAANTGEIAANMIQPLREIVGQAEMASNAVRQLRSVLKPTATAHAERIPGELVREAIAMVASRAVSAGIEIHVTAMNSLPTIFVDPLRIQVVLVQLLTNAIEAVADAAGDGNRGPAAKLAGTTTEAVSSEVRTTISVRLTQTDDGAVSITVRNPVGKLPACKQDLLFEPFFSTRPAGRGLGLAISRSIAESYGGTLEINESAQDGVSVTLTIPCRAGKTNHDETKR